MKRLLFIPLLLLALSVGAQNVLRTNAFYTAPAVAAASYCAEYQAVYDEYGTPPHDTIAAKWNTFVETLVDDGVWDSIDVMWVFAIDAAANALINWITPGTYTATNVNSVSFTAHEGFTSDVSADYIDLNWNPHDNSTMFTLNRACVGIYNRTSLGNNNYVETGCGDGTNRIYIQSESNTGVVWGMLNNSGTAAEFSLTGNASGMKVLVRLASGAKTLVLYDNKTTEVDAFSYDGASTSIPDLDAFGCCWNNNGSPANYSGQQISLIFYGGFKSAASVNSITDAFETVMDSNGRGVIP